MRVEALGQRRVDISSVFVHPRSPGVVVEVVGGAAVVEHELRRSSQSTIGPCARQAAPDWYFAAGDTGLGAEDWLALFNPFPDDAIVDLTFLTAAGVQAPGQAQAVVVPRHSRLSFPVSTIVRDQANLAVHVHARTGRVVAEQSLYFDGTNGPAGLTTALGATSPSVGVAVPDRRRRVRGHRDASPVANFANTGTRVQVELGPRQQHGRARRCRSPSRRMGITEREPLPAGRRRDRLLDHRARPQRATRRRRAAPNLGAAGHGHGSLDDVRRHDRRQAVGVRAGPGRQHQRRAACCGQRVGNRSASSCSPTPPGIPTAPAARRRKRSAPGSGPCSPSAPTGVGTDQVVVLQSDGAIVAGRLTLGTSPSMSLGLPELP